MVEEKINETITQKYIDTYHKLEELYNKSNGNPSYMFSELKAETNEFLKGFRDFVAIDKGEDISPMDDEIFSIIADIIERRGNGSLEVSEGEEVEDKYYAYYNELKNKLNEKRGLFRRKPSLESILKNCSTDFIIGFRNYIGVEADENIGDFEQQLLDSLEEIISDRREKAERSGR